MHPVMKRTLLAIAILASVASCARRQEEPATDAAAQADANPAAAAAGGAEEPEPPKVVAAVNANIRLSSDAQQAVSSKGDSIIVEAIYAGDPTPESQNQVNALGLIELGKTSQTLSASGPVGFDKSSIDAARRPLIVGQPQVILNVRSKQGLIACPMYWESVKVASEKVVDIDCTLAGATP